MENEYLLVINGKPEGPYSIQQLKELKITAGDFVKTHVMDDYKEAAEVTELCEAFGFAKYIVMPQYFAGFDQRLLAAALDWFFILALCIVLAFVISLFINDKAGLLEVAIVMLLIMPVIKLPYSIVMECSAKQGTYGKLILNIKVADLQGKRITISTSAARNLLKILSVVTFGIGYLFIFFNKRQQSLHDMAAGTLLVKERLI